MTRRGKQSPALLGLLIFIGSTPLCSAYSLLTHEQLVDIAWKDQIQPMLQARFPNATPQELSKAHACAYGGCLIRDIGYYPFGSEFFSDLTHYVRSGDFVANLIRESADVNELAFALGALSHYVSDISAHPSINRAVALRYTSDRYHDFIGFEVAKPLLDRVMVKTYGLNLKDTLGPLAWPSEPFGAQSARSFLEWCEPPCSPAARSS